MRPIVIAVALTLLALSAYMAAGFGNTEVPLYETCQRHGYPATDSGLAMCADYLGLPCGDLYTDHLRPGCAEIGTAKTCILDAGEVVCVERP